MNAAMLLHKAAIQRPEHVAVRHGERAVSYQELSDRVRRLAAGLRDLGLEEGDRVAVLLHNGVELIETIQAVLCAGLCVVPINVRSHPMEVAYLLEDSGAAALVHDAELGGEAACAAVAQSAGRGGNRGMRRVVVGADGESGALDGGALGYEAFLEAAPALPAPVEVAPDAVAWLFYTSGTTGRPKGAMWLHRTMVVTVIGYLADIHALQPEDAMLHAAPLTHGSGVVALAALARGAENVLLPDRSFDPEAFFDVVHRRRVTNVAFLAPTQIVALLDAHDPARHPTESVRRICYGGAPMFVEDLRRALRAFGPVLVQVYGQGEAPMTISYLRPQDHARFAEEGDPRFGSAGVARTDVEVMIDGPDGAPLMPGEVGEIVVRGEVVMPGYWRQPEATAATIRDGWLRTGDVGMLDEHGYLYILDRSKDMIVSGGNNIYPRELEEVILTLSEVSEVAVIGVPDEYWGESVHAIVACRPGCTLTSDDIVAVCRSHLASYKKPRTVAFVDALPKNAYGKVVKRELREAHWDGYERRIAGGRSAGAERSA